MIRQLYTYQKSCDEKFQTLLIRGARHLAYIARERSSDEVNPEQVQGRSEGFSPARTRSRSEIVQCTTVFT